MIVQRVMSLELRIKPKFSEHIVQRLASVLKKMEDVIFRFIIKKQTILNMEDF